ncbi:MAG: tRNA (guanine-N(1)-)-methyltransferase [Candidatus Omnitrophica bacterium]|nr:tRNA (guanine-N(1)-)-methyltransferase [Candidatus Omnitrophota bacterium]
MKQALDVRVLTLFPGMFETLTGHSIVKRAIEKGALTVRAHDLREYTHDRHRTADDRPFGGGPGMLMKPEPIFEAMDDLMPGFRKTKTRRFVYLTPQGEPYTQRKAEELAQCRQIVLLCGHYEGVDQRAVDRYATDEISIGDYVLTGGELPAMVLIDSVARLLPGTLGCAQSKEFESFSGDLLEYPQYTRPAEYRGLKVPPVLLSGNHQAIEAWRRQQSLERTRTRRPDLLAKAPDRGVKAKRGKEKGTCIRCSESSKKNK